MHSLAEHVAPASPYRRWSTYVTVYDRNSSAYSAVLVLSLGAGYQDGPGGLIGRRYMIFRDKISVIRWWEIPTHPNPESICHGQLIFTDKCVERQLQRTTEINTDPPGHEVDPPSDGLAPLLWIRSFQQQASWLCYEAG